MTDSLGIEGEEFDVLSPEIDHKYETINSIAVSTSYLKPNNNVLQSFHCTFLLHHDEPLVGGKRCVGEPLVGGKRCVGKPLVAGGKRRVGAALSLLSVSRMI